MVVTQDQSGGYPLDWLIHVEMMFMKGHTDY